MAIAWYIVPYKLNRGEGDLYRYCAIKDYSPQIIADGGKWAETEVLGDRAIVKVRASDSTLSILDGQYKHLPKDRLDDSLTDLPANIKQALKNELLDMGYSIDEIRARFGEDLGQYTLRDILRFATTRRLKPRYDAQADKVVCDGIDQKCRPIESVDAKVQ